MPKRCVAFFMLSSQDIGKRDAGIFSQSNSFYGIASTCAEPYLSMIPVSILPDRMV